MTDTCAKFGRFLYKVEVYTWNPLQTDYRWRMLPLLIFVRNS